MVTRFATRATFAVDINFVSLKIFTFLVPARRATLFPTDGQHKSRGESLPGIVGALFEKKAWEPPEEIVSGDEVC